MFGEETEDPKPYRNKFSPWNPTPRSKKFQSERFQFTASQHGHVFETDRKQREVGY